MSHFLKAYEQRITQVLHEIESVNLMQIPTGDLNLAEVSNLLNGLVHEVKRLEKSYESKIEALNKHIEGLQAENKRLNDQLFSDSYGE